MKIVWDRRCWVDWLFGKKVFTSIEPPIDKRINYGTL